LLARLPEAFLLLLLIALVFAIYSLGVIAREARASWLAGQGASVRAAVLTTVQ